MVDAFVGSNGDSREDVALDMTVPPATRDAKGTDVVGTLNPDNGNIPTGLSASGPTVPSIPPLPMPPPQHNSMGRRASRGEEMSANSSSHGSSAGEISAALTGNDSDTAMITEAEHGTLYAPAGTRGRLELASRDTSSGGIAGLRCRLKNCACTAVFCYEGDADPSYCKAHKPIEASNNQVQPCYTTGCSRRVSHGWKNSGTVSSCLLHATRVQGMVQKSGVPCEFPVCHANPSYAMKGERQGRFCKKHKESNMVFVNSRHCDVPDCQRSALWKEAANESMRVCQDHRKSGVAYSQLAAICAEKDCFEEPYFGNASSGKPLYCTKHKAEGMAEVRQRNCAMPGCGKIPSYGVDGKREMCRDHKGKDMTYAILTCESPLCNKNPSFAPRGETRRRFCKRHAEPHMVNVYYKYCGVVGCPERASFEAGDKLRCLAHIEPGMKPRNNICQVAGGGCTRQSSYGPEGGKPVVCTVHREPGMMQVRTKKCKHQGCEKIPSYGYPCMSREYCKPHALEGMVYSAGSRCRFRGCRAAGAFNHPGVRGGSFCKKHKEDGMVDVQPVKCEEVGCNYAASFGDTNHKKKRFCSRHKLPGMGSVQDMLAESIPHEGPASPAESSTSGSASAGRAEARSASKVSTTEKTFTGVAETIHVSSMEFGLVAPAVLPSLVTPEGQGILGSAGSIGSTTLKSSADGTVGAIADGFTVASADWAAAAAAATAPATSAISSDAAFSSACAGISPDAFSTASSGLAETSISSAEPPIYALTSASAASTVGLLPSGTHAATSATAVGVASDLTISRTPSDASNLRRTKRARKESTTSTPSGNNRGQLPPITTSSSYAAVRGITPSHLAPVQPFDMRTISTSPGGPAHSTVSPHTQILNGQNSQSEARSPRIGSYGDKVSTGNERLFVNISAASPGESGGLSIASPWAWLISGMDTGGALPAANVAAANLMAAGRGAPSGTTPFTTPAHTATSKQRMTSSGEPASASTTPPSQDLQSLAKAAAAFKSWVHVTDLTSDLNQITSRNDSPTSNGVSRSFSSGDSTHATAHVGQTALTPPPALRAGASVSAPQSHAILSRQLSVGDRLRKAGFGGVYGGGVRTEAGIAADYSNTIWSNVPRSTQIASSSSSALSSIQACMATAASAGSPSLFESAIISTEPRVSLTKEGKSKEEEETFLSSLLGSMDPADPKTARVRGAMMARLRSITN